MPVWNATIRLARRFAGLMLLTVMVLSSCDDVTGPEQDFSRARKLWEKVGPSDYRFTLYNNCGECPAEAYGPVVLEVREGVVISRHYVKDGVPVSPSLAYLFPEVQALFSVIAEALKGGADFVEATYDPTLGYPIQISIAYKRGIADGGQGYTVREFSAR